VDLGFHGEVVDFYDRYRHGYPEPVVDVLVDALGLTAADVVLDLGCGTGQLTLPLAGRVRGAVGVDPEPDMLVAARRAASRRGVGNAAWLLGSDADLPALGALFDGLGAVTVAQALHWMRSPGVFSAAARLVRPGGGVAVVTNGAPLWLHDAEWSRALRAFLEDWLGTRLGATCGTDEASQRRYAGELTAAGFTVHRRSASYTNEIDVDYIVGNVYSALSDDQLPAPAERPGFARRLDDALRPHRPFTEHTVVSMVIGCDR
jgi:ubiquinone/menaquinone biosynthesis C-methylase UbiE